MGKLPKLKRLFFTSKMFYHEINKQEKLPAEFKNKVPLWVPEESINKDQSGSFIWRLNAEQDIGAYKPVAEIMKVEKVRVTPSDLFKDVTIGRFCALKYSGSLKMYDVLAVYISGCENLKDGDEVVLAVDRWLFNPGEIVRVRIPKLTTKGFYINDYAVFKDTDDEYYVYILKNGKMRISTVFITGGYSAKYQISGPDIKAGTIVFISGIPNHTQNGTPVKKYTLVDQ